MKNPNKDETGRRLSRITIDGRVVNIIIYYIENIKIDKIIS